MANIKQFLPHANFGRKAELDTTRCSYGVWNGYGWYQCQNAANEEIEGYGFCQSHAVIVKGQLGQAEIIGYFYQIESYGKGIKQIPYTKRTNSFYWDEKGYKTKIDRHYSSKLFETYEEAIEYKHKSLKDAVISSKRRAEEAEKELAEFEANLLEANNE